MICLMEWFVIWIPSFVGNGITKDNFLYLKPCSCLQNKKGLGLRPRRSINMSKIDDVMKAWQEDHQKVSWQDLQTLKAENEALRVQLSEKNLGQGEPVGQCMEHGECFGGECIYATKPNPAPQQKPLTDVITEFNRAIDFAIEQGIEAAVFLRNWREGDTSEWPEFHQPIEAAHNIGEKK